MFTQSKDMSLMEVEDKKPLITELKPGDIVIQLEKAKKLEEKLDSPAFLSTTAHSMIYAGDNEVIHSTTGRYKKMVTKHPLTKLVEMSEPLGSALVLRISDHKLSAEVLNQANKVNNNPATVFSYWDARREAKQNASSVEFFRGFSVNHRISSKQSVSKNKGISCGNFVSLIIKSAMISLLFPDGLPENIIKQLKKIEEIRTDQKNKKLDAVPLEEFKKFEALVKEAISEDNPYKKYLPELYRMVKHTKLADFVSYAIDKPELFQPLYLFYDTDKFLQPKVMDDTAYTAFLKKNDRAKEKVSSSDIVAACEAEMEVVRHSTKGQG